jgi:hypothetical protein
MISFSQRPKADRRATPATSKNAAAFAVLSDASFGGVTFASELATANDAPRGDSMSAWNKVLELARAGGGAARITMNIASGEKVDLRVSVRGGLVTVVAHVGSRAAEKAIMDTQDTIARALLETGLKLQRFHVRHKKASAGKGKQTRSLHKRHNPLTSDQEDREEQS